MVVINSCLERDLHLGLDPVIILGADVLTTETTGVLQLHTALLVEPVLDADGEVRLIPAIDLRVTVEGLARSHDIESIDHGNTGRHIATHATHFAILTTQPLCTDAGRTGLLVFRR